MPLDLLRNRDPLSALGPFDGKVGAWVSLRGEEYFVTTNTDYIPAPPSLELPHALFLRSDMRYGTDDYTLWPQEWTSRHAHLAVIAQPGSRPEIDVMWWDPSPADFVVGSALTRGLGKLQLKQFSKFLPPINQLVEQCRQLQKNSKDPIPPIFSVLINTVLLQLEQLQTLPTTYAKMVFGLTSMQRAFLELDAFYNYFTIYQPRMQNYMLATSSNHTPIARCIGAFTTIPTVAQQMFAARLPFWFLRPFYVFDAENILAVVPPREPMFNNAPGTATPPIVYSGNSTLEKIGTIQRAAAEVAWYRDPFGTTPGLSSPPAPPSTQSSASSSRLTEPSKNHQPRYTPYLPNSSKKISAPPKKTSTKQPPKPQRDKFSAFVGDGMPPSIVSWADALARVDQSIPPFTSDPADKRYVLPEPALLVNSTPDRRRKFLHHWNLFSDLFFYMLSQPGHAELLTVQEWRDVLEGLITKRGASGSRTNSGAWGSRNASSASTPSSPRFSLEQTQEIVWQVAETSFRFEFCSLDRRASKKDRVDAVKACFAGGMLLGTPLEFSKRGWAATAIEERHRYVVRTATLMLDWTTKSPRPNIIRCVAERMPWSASLMQDLEKAVCVYYTQAFWEHFGQAAVLPLCLDHELDVEKEDSEL
ncbi:hypothetical protein C8J57DRAFT_1493266 [Mycena rebaudengoi]|nr:hypothetical protein C8J57DRAFT_1493266 [Mycena rebaudengoi]